MSEETPDSPLPEASERLVGPWDLYECDSEGMAADAPADRLSLETDGSFRMHPLPLGLRELRGTWGVTTDERGWVRVEFVNESGHRWGWYIVLASMPDGPEFMNWQRSRGDAVVFKDRVARCHRPEGSVNRGDTNANSG